MKKLAERLLMFIIGVPVVVGVIVLLPQKNHLALNIIVIIFSALGAIEFAEILKRKNLLIKPKEAALLGSACPLAMTLSVSFNFAEQLVYVFFLLGASWVIISVIFVKEEALKNAVSRVSAGFAVMVYPGLFMMWIIRMNGLPNSEMIVLMFLLIVFANDSAAWAFGLLFGKGNRGVILVSPNKSVAGFIGGIGFSTVLGLITVYLVPDGFTSHKISPPLAGVILGFLSAVAATLGDLGESALKRSSDMKDSGTLIPGRGGVLDSIDSLILAAPVYYVSYRLLFV